MRLLIFGALPLVLAGALPAAVPGALAGREAEQPKPVKKRISAAFLVQQAQVETKDGPVCLIVPQVRFSAVKGATSYSVTYWDGYYQREESRSLTSPPAPAYAGAPALVAPKGEYWLPLAGAAAGGSCGEGAAVTVQQYVQRFKRPVVFANFPKDPGFLLAGHVNDEGGKPIPGVRLLIVGNDERKAVTTDDSGAFEALLPKGRYAVGTGVKDKLTPVESGDCEIVGKEKNCQVHLTRDRRNVDFEIEAPKILIFKAELGAYVRPQSGRRSRGHTAVRAGTPFLIHLKLRNTSNRRITIWPYWPKLSGNATDGHVQKENVPVNSFDAKGSLDEVRGSPFITLKPKMTREFDVVVRTKSYDIYRRADEKRACRSKATCAPLSSASAIVKFPLPRLARLPKGDSLDIEQKDIEILDPEKAVEMEVKSPAPAGPREFKVIVDDRDPWQPEKYFHLWVETQIDGLLEWAVDNSWGTARALFYDFPREAVLSWWYAPLSNSRLQLALWHAIKDKPEAQQLAAEIKERLLPIYGEAPFMAPEELRSDGPALNIAQWLDETFTRSEQNYYAGNWQEESRNRAKIGLDIGSAVASAPQLLKLTSKLLAGSVLVRFGPARRALKAARAAELAKGAAELEDAANVLAKTTPARLVQAGRESETLNEALSASKVEIPASQRLSPKQLLQVGGYTTKQDAALAALAHGKAESPLLKGKRFIITMFVRGKYAAQAVLAGARGKMAWIKPKGVILEDVKYLGYDAGDLGLQAWIEPPPTGRLLAYFEKKQFTAAERAEGLARWRLRVKEWNSPDGDQVQKLILAGKKGKVQGGVPRKGNYDDPKIKDEVWQEDFDVTSREVGGEGGLGDPFGRQGDYPPRQKYIPFVKEGERGTGKKWVRIAGDPDGASVTTEFGTSLDDATRLEFEMYMRNEVGTTHGFTGDFANDEVRKSIMKQGAPGFQWRFNSSRPIATVLEGGKFKSSSDSIWFWKGGEPLLGP